MPKCCAPYPIHHHITTHHHDPTTAMIKLSRPQSLMLHLLSAALHDACPDASLFAGLDDADWQAIIGIAKRQSVLALVGDRILQLPTELMPSRSIRLELGMAIQLVEAEGRRITADLHEIAEEYAGENLPFVLLKGPTMAQYYPQPLLRSTGDLDVYLPHEGDYDRANEYARRRGYRMQGDSLYEQLYWRGRTAVENHRLLTYFGIARYDRALEAIVRPIAEADGWAFTNIDGHRYRTLPLELDVAYCFQHILHHFSYLGIGFRQVCDWVLLLENHGERIDLDLFTDYAESLDLLRPMGYFALMTVRHLGISPTIFPFALPQGREAERLADLILGDILRGGNFGLETFAGRKFKSMWARRWFMFRRTTARSFRVAPISPEHIRLIPLVAIATRIRLFLRR